MRRTSRPGLRLAFALSGLLPLAGIMARPVETQALVWTVFVAVLLMAPGQRTSGPGFVLAAVATGMAVELAAWAGHYATCTPQPALFHPQLGRDLMIGAGFYAGLGLAWAWLVRRFGFSVGECFAVNGAMGVFLEQKGAAFLAGLRPDGGDPTRHAEPAAAPLALCCRGTCRRRRRRCRHLRVRSRPHGVRASAGTSADLRRAPMVGPRDRAASPSRWSAPRSR